MAIERWPGERGAGCERGRACGGHSAVPCAVSCGGQHVRSPYSAFSQSLRPSYWSSSPSYTSVGGRTRYNRGLYLHCTRPRACPAALLFSFCRKKDRSGRLPFPGPGLDRSTGLGLLFTAPPLRTTLGAHQRTAVLVAPLVSCAAEVFIAPRFAAYCQLRYSNRRVRNRSKRQRLPLQAPSAKPNPYPYIYCTSGRQSRECCVLHRKWPVRREHLTDSQRGRHDQLRNLTRQLWTSREHRHVAGLLDRRLHPGRVDGKAEGHTPLQNQLHKRQLASGRSCARKAGRTGSPLLYGTRVRPLSTTTARFIATSSLS